MKSIIKIATVIVIVILCAVAIGYKHSPVRNADYWRSKVAQVALGMKRSDVERLLPSKIGGYTIESGSCQSELYFLDNGWQISICYDHASVRRDEKGTALESSSPDNRVLTVPVLSKRTDHRASRVN